MRWIVLFVVACGSSNPREVPADHRLHDLSSETGEAKYWRYGGKQVSLSDLPVAGKIGLPVNGTADVMIDLTVPKSYGALDYAKATGTISITCTTCQLGDDDAKLFLPMFEDGIYFSHLTFDRLDARFVIGKGGLVMTRFEIESPDVDVQLALALDLATSLDDSAVRGCVRFRPTEALRMRDPKMFDLLQLTGAARDPNGFEQVRLAGTFGDVKRLGTPCYVPIRSTGRAL
jgi:type II secretion system protein N